jgi:hypothetical protein
LNGSLLISSLIKGKAASNFPESRKDFAISESSWFFELKRIKTVNGGNAGQ